MLPKRFLSSFGAVRGRTGELAPRCRPKVHCLKGGIFRQQTDRLRRRGEPAIGTNT